MASTAVTSDKRPRAYLLVPPTSPRTESLSGHTAVPANHRSRLRPECRSPRQQHSGSRNQTFQKNNSISFFFGPTPTSHKADRSALQSSRERARWPPRRGSDVVPGQECRGQSPTRPKGGGGGRCFSLGTLGATTRSSWTIRLWRCWLSSQAETPVLRFELKNVR